ncbi:MerR family transcriptional regulator [Bdellovibrio sp. HCB290]|uniref:MerR family transcriptional regulator n=1 Tax=Bdellovibrio sp. HCB290 TaxID=3394356 RepID=UPI0039B584CE
MMKDWLSVGEFGKKTGLSHKALRIYEEKGLLIPHSRSEGQHRVYTESQLETARKIVQFKDWGFSLEQIKVLLIETSESTLKELLERRLQESRTAAVSITQQINALISVLASLNAGHELTELERSQVMENLLDRSVGNLKRRGVVDQESHARVEREVSLYSKDKKALVAGVRNIVDYAKANDILLGPGRGNSASSLVLYSEGYGHFNPLKYGLVPEYFSAANCIWIDVEYSRSHEIGKMAEELARNSELQVFAFRSPVLDILKDVQDKVGKIDFDSFSDEDPMILTAPERLGLAGLYGVEYSENYHAFKKWDKENQKKFSLMHLDFEALYANRPFESVLDFMVRTSLIGTYRLPKLELYNSRKEGNYVSEYPELNDTRGVLAFHEDWDRILSRVAGIPLTEASAIRKRIISEIIADKEPVSGQEVRNLVSDQKTANFLLENVHTNFMKAHALTVWWYYKRTAILKSLWPKEYMAAIECWEQKHQMWWQEFGVPFQDGTVHLKA